MGSPLAPVMANIYMEFFEQQALNTAKKKPSIWYRYIDDTFVVWPRGEEELQIFFQHLNSLHSNIKFTIETGINNRLAFLDVLVKKKPDGLLGHSVYRKPTHTDLYLHAESAHHPTQKNGVLRTLVHRAKTICDTESIGEELQHLKKTFRNQFCLRMGTELVPETLYSNELTRLCARENYIESCRCKSFKTYIKGPTMLVSEF
jgi:hypothetical protein